MELKLTNVTKRYGSLGANGAGKTTIGPVAV